MRKEKFEKKCQELREFEERYYNYTKIRLIESGKKLESIGLALDIDLIFENIPKDIYGFERIGYEDHYVCYIGIQIRKQSDPIRDMDLESVNLFFPLTNLCKWGFTWLFRRCPRRELEKFERRVDNTILRVLTEGYEEILDELRAVAIK